MHIWIIVAITGVLLVGCIGIIRYILKTKSDYRELIQSIGEVPEPKSVYCAEDYWQLWRQKSAITEEVDNHTWSNLDLNEVYQRFNGCLCEAGSILLYRRLRTQSSPENVMRQERLIDYYKASPESLHKIMFYLNRIGHGNYHTMKTLTLAPETLDTRWKTLVVFLALFPLLCLVTFPLFSYYSIVLAIVGWAINFVATYILKAKIITYQVLYPLSALVYCSKKMLPYLKECDQDLTEQLRICINKCNHLNTFFSIMRYSDLCEKIGLPDMTGLLLLPIFSYHRALRFVQKETDCIAQLYDLVGEIDFACAIHSFRESLPYWAKPIYTNDHTINASAIYHLSLEEAVANDISTNRNILLTGSNASGKTTFIKTIAVNLILAQAINTACAKSLLLHRSTIITAMAVSDSLFEGESYFIAEIKAMKRLVDKTQTSAFCYLFIDEILRGTNTVERIAAAFSFLNYFNDKNVLCFAASHDIELVSMTSPQYEQFHFTEQIKHNSILFDYKLRNGPAKTRNALKLLETKNFPLQITATAKKMVDTFEAYGFWQTD